MNSTFDLGNLGESVVKLALDRIYKNPRMVPKDINTQLEWGDIAINGCRELGIPRKKIEVKTELKHTGNLFFETMSNAKIGRKGWALTSQADELYYLFWQDAIGYRIPDFQRTMWIFDYDKKDFQEREQNKHEQNNQTIGRLVPVEWLLSTGVGAATFDFSELKDVVIKEMEQAPHP